MPTMKAYELGVLTSYSRPRVSNDNPFAEALFRTLSMRQVSLSMALIV